MPRPGNEGHRGAGRVLGALGVPVAEVCLGEQARAPDPLHAPEPDLQRGCRLQPIDRQRRVAAAQRLLGEAEERPGLRLPAVAGEAGLVEICAQGVRRGGLAPMKQHHPEQHQRLLRAPPVTETPPRREGGLEARGRRRPLAEPAEVNAVKLVDPGQRRRVARLLRGAASQAPEGLRRPAHRHEPDRHIEVRAGARELRAGARGPRGAERVQRGIDDQERLILEEIDVREPLVRPGRLQQGGIARARAAPPPPPPRARRGLSSREADHPREHHRHAARHGPARPRHGALQPPAALRHVPHAEVRLAELPLQARRGGRVAPACAARERERERERRVAVGADMERLLPRDHPVARLRLRLARHPPVVREDRRALGRPGVGALDGPRDLTVEQAALGVRELREHGLTELVVREVDAARARLQHRRRNAAGEPGVERVGRREPREHGQIELATGHRREIEQRPDLGRELAEPALQHALHAARRQVARQAGGPDALERPRLGGERPDHLHQKEGVPLGLPPEEAHQIRVTPRGAQHGLAQLGDALLAEPLEPQQRRAGQRPGQRRGLVVPVAGHDEQRHLGRDALQPLQHGQALVPRPVEILEEEDRRSLQPAHERLDGREEPRPRRLRIQGGGRGHGPIEQGRDVGHEPLEDAGLVVRRRAQQAQPAEGAPQDLVRTAVLPRRLPLQDEDIGDERPGAHLPEQARFADAALAPHEPGAAPARARLIERLQQHRELALAPDEPRRLEEAVQDRRGLRRRRQAGRLVEGREGALRARVAILRPLGEQAVQHRGERRRDARRGRIGGAAERPVLEPKVIAPLERPAPREDLEGDHPHRIEVAGLGRRRAGEGLGRHVIQRSPDPPPASRREPALARRRDPEIEHPHTPVGHEHVRRLQVAVNDALPVQVRERLEHLRDQVDLRGERAPSRLLEDRARVLDQLHREIRLPVLVESIVQHADDIGVAQGRERLEFAGHAQAHLDGGIDAELQRSPAARRAGVGADLLERDRAPGQPVHGAIHHPHAPTAEGPVEQIPPADQRLAPIWPHTLTTIGALPPVSTGDRRRSRPSVLCCLHAHPAAPPP